MINISTRYSNTWYSNTVQYSPVQYTFDDGMDKVIGQHKNMKKA